MAPDFLIYSRFDRSRFNLMYSKPVVTDFSYRTLRYLAMVLVLVVNLGDLNTNAQQPEQMSSDHQATHEIHSDFVIIHSAGMAGGGSTVNAVHSHIGDNTDGQCYEGGCCPGSSMTTCDCWSLRSFEIQRHCPIISDSYLSVSAKVAGHPPKHHLSRR